jgi:hypothetical protein
MTQAELDFSAPVRESLTVRLSVFFKARLNQPVDMHVLDQHFGCGGWRTRVSELRFAPYWMDVENKWWNEKRADGTPYRVSVYTYRGPKGREVAA